MDLSTERTANGPANDERTHYDYEISDMERPGFVRDLRDRIDGEVRFDDLTRVGQTTTPLFPVNSVNRD